MSTISTTSVTSTIAIPAFSISGIRATAIINAAAVYNAAQLKLNAQFVALTPAQYFELQIDNQQFGQATQEVIRQLRDSTNGAFVDAMLSAPTTKRADLLAVANASAAS